MKDTNYAMRDEIYRAVVEDNRAIYERDGWVMSVPKRDYLSHKQHCANDGTLGVRMHRYVAAQTQ